MKCTICNKELKYEFEIKDNICEECYLNFSHLLINNSRKDKNLQDKKDKKDHKTNHDTNFS